jgi:3-oxoacyl-[acyl-carrier-protein] synthase-3
MKIIGTGSALPALEVTNNDLAEFLDTSDVWISTRTGIKSRHLLSTESLYDLAVDAANKAIKSAGLTPDQIDFLLVSNVANQHITPGLSCIIQNRIGVTCAGLDINVACAGFVNALMLADGMMKAGHAKNILIVCAEEPTKYCDWHERDCSVLFGDGAGAVVLAPGDAFKDVKLTMISDRDVLYYERGMESTPFEKQYTKGQPLVMKGKELFRTAVSESAKDINTVLQRNNLKHDDIKYFLLHQANKRIIEGIRNLVGGPDEKYPTTIEKYGNTSSASIPIMLDEMLRDNKIKAGDKIIMSAFGAGFVSAACLWEWEN